MRQAHLPLHCSGRVHSGEQTNRLAEFREYKGGFAQVLLTDMLISKVVGFIVDGRSSVIHKIMSKNIKSQTF